MNPWDCGQFRAAATALPARYRQGILRWSALQTHPLALRECHQQSEALDWRRGWQVALQSWGWLLEMGRHGAATRSGCRGLHRCVRLSVKHATRLGRMGLVGPICCTKRAHVTGSHQLQKVNRSQRPVKIRIQMLAQNTAKRQEQFAARYR
jgi:hypothetical protein